MNTKRKYPFVGVVIGAVVFLAILFFTMPQEHVQPKKQIVRLAYLTKDAPAHNRVRHTFMDALRKDIDREYQVAIYYTQGEDRLKATAGVEEALLNGTDIFVANGALMSQVVKSVTDRRKRDTPIVIINTTNPVGLGLIESEERPGGNLTGIDMQQGGDIVPAQMLLFLKPSMKHLLIPYCPLASGGLLEEIALASANFFRKNGVRVTLLPIESVADVVSKVKSFISSVDTIMNLEGCLTSAAAEGMIKLCNQYGKTFFSGELAVVKQGAACGFGADFGVSGVKAVEYVRLIVSGDKKPGDLPFLHVANGRRVGLNRATAEGQGLHLSNELLRCIQKGIIFEDCEHVL